MIFLVGLFSLLMILVLFVVLMLLLLLFVKRIDDQIQLIELISKKNSFFCSRLTQFYLVANPFLYALYNILNYYLTLRMKVFYFIN